MNCVPCQIAAVIRSPQTGQGQALTTLAECPSAHSTDSVFIVGPSAVGRNAAADVVRSTARSTAKKTVYYVTYILFV